MAPLMLSSSHLSLTFCSRKNSLSDVHAATYTRSSLAPCFARLSLDGSAVAARRCKDAFCRSGVPFCGVSATATPFVVCNQAYTTKPMHTDTICKIFSGTADPKVSKDIASKMDTDFKIKPVNGCGKNVQLPESVLDCHVYLLQPICTPAYNNEELLSMIDACKVCKARSITVVMPFAPKVRGRELFDQVKEVACQLDPHHGVQEILSFDFNPMLGYENPPPNTAITATSIMRHYLEHIHKSGLIVMTSQNSDGVDSTKFSFKKDFQHLAVINNALYDDTAGEAKFIRDVEGPPSAILIENILHTNAGLAFLRSRGTKNVYTCYKEDADSVLTVVAKFLTDAMSLVNVNEK